MASKIKVDNIENQCGGAVVTKCGATTTISGSVVKANDIQAADGGNLINQCGTTITLGASGDTINLAAGATQSGFGRTGTVDWDTTAKTASFTAVSGNGYFVNTTSGAITLTLPATPSAGDIVGFNDYARTFATNNLTVARNGSNIQSVATDIIISTNGQSSMFVYVDSTQGWVPTEDQTTGNYGAQYIAATGGTVTCCGDYKIHTFTGPGTFTVTNAGNPAGSDTVDYLVVAGGGGGGKNGGAGGGAGGYRESSGTASGCYTASPLGACVAALPVSVTAYPITVGSGGSGASANGKGGDGSNSVFSTITSTGGGGGAGRLAPGIQNAGSGGSGGGVQYDFACSQGAGNTPPVSPPQGNPGGVKFPSTNAPAGGGGGAVAAGQPTCYVNGPATAGTGGPGATSSINATPTAYAGGGGGGAIPSSPPTMSLGGPGGGGRGEISPPGTPAVAGSANTGGGGGGAMCGSGGAGGSGIVIIRYKYQ